MLKDEQRTDLQMIAASAYDAGDLDVSRRALDLLGGTTYSQQLADLIDGHILNAHLAKPRIVWKG